MARLDNDASFQLAQILSSSGDSVLLDDDAESCLSLLCAVVNALLAEPGQTVLLGWAYEQSGQDEQEGSVWWKISGSPMPQRQGWRIIMAAGGAAADLPHHTVFLPAALALDERLHERGGLLLPPHGIWPALQIESLAAAE